MQDWQHLGQNVYDNIGLILIILLVAGFLAGWLIFQTFRSAEDRGDIDRLRRKLRDLEIERAQAYSNAPRRTAEALTDPIVLTPRWVRRGGAATSTDGGCLVIVNDTAGPAQKALLTVRIDGVAVYTEHGVRAGRSLQAEGNMGIYTVLVGAVEPLQALLSVSLRSRHARAVS